MKDTLLGGNVREQDLGVQVFHKLNMTSQYDAAIKKAIAV